MFTELKTAVYDGEIEDLIRRYPGEFQRLETGSAAKKYFRVEREGSKSAILMVSKDPLGSNLPEYNFMVSVHGEDKIYALKVFEKFTKILCLQLKDPPKRLGEISRHITEMLKVN